MGVEKRGQVYSQTSLWDLFLLLALECCVLICLTHGFSIKKKRREKYLWFKVVGRTADKVYQVPGMWEIANKCQPVAAAGVEMKVDS